MAAARIAVLSDMHAHAEAFESALNAARREGFDEMLLLGDLLTYGVEPDRTLDLTEDAIARDGAHLVLGNHDQLYLDLEAGSSSYVDNLPDWIRESVDWTRNALRDPLTSRSLPWREQWVFGNLFAAHANPFAYGDWTYLANEAEHEMAGATLTASNFKHGVFGHTHRAASTLGDGDRADVIVVGSLGQPRDGRPGVSQWAMLTLTDAGCAVSNRPVKCDWAAHMARIRATSMSQPTKDRLCRFFSL